MTDMRVKMILDLVANTKGGAGQVKRELKGVKDAAQDLNRTEAGRKIKRDMLELAPASRRAAQYLRETKAAAAGIGADGGAARLARDLERARSSMAKLKAEARSLRGQLNLPPSGTAANDGSRSGGVSVLPGMRGLLGGYLGVQGARAGVRGTVGQSVSFEKAMADVLKKVDLPAGQTQIDLERMITGSAIKFGRSREQIAGLAAELGAAGVAYKDLGQAIALATKASVSWDMIPSETGEKLAKIRTQHNKTLEELEVFGDKVNALADSGASKERSIVEMFQRAAAGAKVADVDEDTSLAFMTAMNAGGMADEIAARGFGAMISKLRTAKSTGNKKMAEGLKMLGLTPEGVEKGIKTDSLATMLDLMDRFSKSSDKAAVAVKMFGQEWWDEFARMVQSAPEIAKNLKLLSDPKNYAGSMNKSLAIELATTSNHLERLKALASDVGDRMGRWALPPINDAIDKIVRGLDALDARDADKLRERQAKAAEDATAGKIAGDQPLSDDERERMARDGAYRQRVQKSAGDKRTDKANIGLNDGLRLSELLGERERLEASIGARRKAGASEDQLAYSVSRLEGLLDQVRAIDPSKAPPKPVTDPRRPADQDERGRADRGEAMALRERVAQLESRLAAQEALAKASGNPSDQTGFGGDAASTRERLARTRRDLNGTIAPNAGKFGTGNGGAPTGAKPGPVAPGIMSFGLGGARDAGEAWASQLRDSFDIDLGSAGMTMMEKLRSGISSGGAGAKAAADGVNQGVRSAFDGSDLSAAGNALMASLATGIRAGGNQAVAAAQEVAGRVRQAAANVGSAGSSKAITGALHDGVV